MIQKGNGARMTTRKLHQKYDSTSNEHKKQNVGFVYTTGFFWLFAGFFYFYIFLTFTDILSKLLIFCQLIKLSLTDCFFKTNGHPHMSVIN